MDAAEVDDIAALNPEGGIVLRDLEARDRHQTGWKIVFFGALLIFGILGLVTSPFFSKANDRRKGSDYPSTDDSKEEGPDCTSTKLILNVNSEEDDGFMSDKLEMVKFAQVRGVDGLLEIDSQQSDNEYNQCVHTQAGLLQPNTVYVVTVDSQVLDEAVEHSSLLFLVRPLSQNGHEFDLAGLSLYVSNHTQHSLLRFHVPDTVTDYTFQIHTQKKVYALVHKIEILDEGNGLSFYPATENVGTSAPENLPTGSENFIVEEPNPAVVREVVANEMNETSADNTGALQAAILECKRLNASRLVVPTAGVYRFTSDESVLFDGLKDFVFDGNGSTFVFYKTSGNAALFQISSCERVEFKNFHVDWDWDQDPLGSIVRVEDFNTEYVNLKFLQYENKTFPIHVPRIGTMEELDPTTKSVGCEDCLDMYFESSKGTGAPVVEWLPNSNNTLRLFLNVTDQGQMERFKSRLTNGTLFRIRHYVYEMHGFVLKDNAHLTLKDIDIYSCPGHALLSYGKQHHWQFIRVNIIRPPGTERPITCTADHHHIGQSQGFFRMENCEFSFGGDDCLNVHDLSAFASYLRNDTVLVKNIHDISMYQPGDPIELRYDDYRPTGFTGTLKNVTHLDGKAYEFTFTEPIPPTEVRDFVLFNWRFNSSNIIVRKCYFHDNRARGLLLLGRDITIEYNRFFHNQMYAIYIGTGYTVDSWSEGYGASNIVIRENVFNTTNLMGQNSREMKPVIYMSVSLRVDPSDEKTMYPILKSILVEGNEFRNGPGVIAFVASAANVTIRNNTILNDVSWRNPSREQGAIVAVSSSGLYVTGNSWITSVNVPSCPVVFFDKNTTSDIHCNGNEVVDP